MSSPAKTSISFQLTDTAVKDKRQTNLTSVEKKNQKTNKQKKQLLSFVNMNIKIKTTVDDVTDVLLRPNYPMLICQKCISIEEEEANGVPCRVEGAFVCKA